ncbi:MAG: serine/threonine-protein kinase [Polyangiaceae bacterium]
MSDLDGLEPGSLLGRYRVERLVAYGGMARVYEGVHVDLQKRVALKVMRPSPGDDRSLLQRFILEARAASRLQHPHVIAITDVGVDRGIAYMVMDLLEGEDLAAHLAAARTLSEGAVTDLLLPIVSALAAAHAEQIVHRDVKPENIFLARTRTSRAHPVLLDFGISKRPVEGRSITRAGQALGTPHYMAPEQLLSGDVDARADQYGFGVVLYQAVTGALPFETTSLDALFSAITRGAAPTAAERSPSVSQEFSAVISRAMRAEASARFATMHELGAALWPFATARARALWAEEFGPRGALPDAPPPPTAPRPTVAEAPTESLETLQRSPAITVSVRSADLRVFGSFAECDGAALDRFLAVTQALRFAKGSHIIRQGAHGHGCYLLVSGEVEVVKATGSHPWVIGRMRPGSVFGQIALVDHVPRTASIVAATEVVVVEISRTDFDGLLRATDEVAHRFREHIVVSGIRQLRRATQQLRALTTTERSAVARREEFARVQVAAKEWDLPIEETADER